MASWVRSVVAVAPDSRGPITPRVIPTVRITADQGCGLVRLTLRRDEEEMTSFTVPFLPVGARLTVDGRDGKARAFHDGIERLLPTFVYDWSGEPLSGLDVSKGDWSIAVDQTPDAAVPLLIEVIATPAGRR